MLKSKSEFNEFSKKTTQTKVSYVEERGEGQDVLEMYLAACARDAGKDTCSFTSADVLAVLKQKGGRLCINMLLSICAYELRITRKQT